MGWLWASSTPSKAPEAGDSSSSSKPASSAPNEPTNVDPEVQKFLDFFDNSSTAPALSSQARSSSSTKPAEESSPSWIASLLKSNRSDEDDGLAHVPPRDEVSESLLPTDMSCRQAFDMAWSCNSLGGQWNAVYRYGEMRSCSDHWDDFWFCMRTKSFTGPTKAAAVRQHYRDREHQRYYAPGKCSSEDVWQAREQKVPEGTAFAQPIEIHSGGPGHDDDEWRRQENERRRQVREGLDSAGSS